MKQCVVLWPIPVLVTIHNLEEAIFMRPALEELAVQMPAQLRSAIPVVTYQQFLIAVLIVTLIPYALILFSKRSHPKSSVLLLLAFQLVMFVNVFSHVGTVVLLKGYAPGLITALTLNLPFSIYLFIRTIREQWVSRRVMVMLVPAALLVHGPGLWGLMRVAGWLNALL